METQETLERAIVRARERVQEKAQLSAVACLAFGLHKMESDQAEVSYSFGQAKDDLVGIATRNAFGLYNFPGGKESSGEIRSAFRSAGAIRSSGWIISCACHDEFVAEALALLIAMELGWLDWEESQEIAKKSKNLFYLEYLFQNNPQKKLPFW